MVRRVNKRHVSEAVGVRQRVDGKESRSSKDPFSAAGVGRCCRGRGI